MGDESLANNVREKIRYTVAQLLKEGTREIDVVASFEENQFAILFMTASFNQAETMCQKIKQTFENLQFSDAHVPLQLKIGLASFSPQTKSLEDLLEAAK